MHVFLLFITLVQCVYEELLVQRFRPVETRPPEPIGALPKPRIQNTLLQTLNIVARQRTVKAFKEGEHYELHSVPRNMILAAQYYANAVHDGNAQAMTKIGEFLQSGRHYALNYNAAAEMFKMAIARGDMRAMVHLAYIQEHGLGDIPRDRAAAMELYMKAAKKGDPDALYRVSKVLDLPRGHFGYKPFLSKAYLGRAWQKGSISAALDLDREAYPLNPEHANRIIRHTMETTDITGLRELAHAFEGPTYFGRDKIRVEMYRKLAEQNDVTSIAKLISSYTRGTLTERNQAMADRYFKRLLRIEDHNVLFQIATSYLEGEAPFYGDIGKGVRILHELATRPSMPDARAMLILADWYARGHNVDRSYNMALEMYFRALAMPGEAHEIARKRIIEIQDLVTPLFFHNPDGSLSVAGGQEQIYPEFMVKIE